MKHLFNIVVLLLLLSSAAPILACMTDSSMSSEERACCRSMHGNCGEMVKMGCCRTEVRTDEQPQLATTAPAIELHWFVIDRLMPELVAVQRVPAYFLDVPDEHSPPGLVIASITVLRI